MLKVMLAAGVGVYCNQLDESYLRILIEQMEKGNMSIVFCDDSICYGVNYPIENIVILKTPLMMNRSVNTLLQLISRAGRKGRSDRANVWVAEPVLDKLSKYISNPDFDDIEFKNIRLACQIAQNEDA
jgi:superfamily II helicase